MFFDEAAFKLDLYRLLCCFYASPAFARLRDSAHRDIASAGDLAGAFEESEITHLLVSIAAHVRVIQDRDRDYFKRVRNTDCGRFVPDVKRPRTSERLSWREACNKIIHAKRFNFDYRYKPRLPDDYAPLRLIVHLHGTQGLSEWKASLNVEAFVAINSVMIKG